MAETKHSKQRAPAPAPEDGLQLEYIPGIRVSYSGTRQQLIDEGVLPPGFELPPSRYYFENDPGAFGLEWSINRSRPPGHGRAPWAHLDYWCFTTWCPTRGREHWSARALHDAQKAVDHEAWCKTPAGQRWLLRLSVAAVDDRFQAVMKSITGRPRRWGR